MTDEKLIEEAAKAIADFQGVRYDRALKETWDGMAHAAFAVFEKAHAPTDDERDELLRDLYSLRGWSGGDPAHRAAIIDRAIAALQRTTEPQGEPSDAQVKAFTDAEWEHRFMVFHGGWSCKCGWSLPGPKLTLDAAEKEHRGHQIRASLKATLGMRVARNEPSDGQVEAAGALLYGISWGTDLADPDLIRDALRAARDA